MPEEGLDLGGVGSALAQARAIGLPAAVGTQSGDTDVGANGQVVDVGLHVHAVGGHRGAVPPRLDDVQLGEGAHHGRDRGAEELAEVDMPVTHQRQLPRRHPGDVRGGLALADVDPPVNTVTQYRPSGSQLLGSEPEAGPKWWCQPSQQVMHATTGYCDGSGIRRAIAPATFPAACGVPAPRRRLRAGTPPSGSSISGLETNATVGRAAS